MQGECVMEELRFIGNTGYDSFFLSHREARLNESSASLWERCD